jgi:two-component system cell cycle sensor histidine kinase/response regulator CckA
MHKLLLRQIRRAGISVDDVPPALAQLCELVDEAYGAADTERALMERSLELTSSELLGRNRVLRSDLVARQQAQEALVRGQRELREIIEELPSAVFVRRGPRVIFVNTTTVRVLGYEDASQIVGRSIMDFIHPEDHARAVEAMKQFEDRPGEGGASMEYRVQRRDGRHAVLERTTVKEIAFEGENAVLLVFNDVTDRKEMLERLRLADRMASLGTVAAGVAHEINNPLAYVVANLTYLGEVLERRNSRESVDWEEFGKAVADASTGAERVRHIVSSLKTFSRGDEEHRGPVQLEDVLKAAVDMCWNELRHRAKLVIEPSSSPPVEGNAVRLGQVFVNLLINAAHAIPVGAADLNEIRVATSLDGCGRVVVAVSDTGYGMSREIMSRIFEPFFTTKPIGVGTGLGLAICHGIVAAMGGELEVESEPGHGTTFRVILQPSRGPSTRPPPEVAAPKGAPRRARVLVVDDEAAVGSVVRRLLGREHDVVAVTSGRAALAMLTHGERFDVIACDMMMPDLCGMDFYEELVTQFPASAERVFFMTGGVFTPRAQAFLERTGLTRLNKPFDSESLRGTVRAVAARKQPAAAAVGPPPDRTPPRPLRNDPFPE